MKKFTTACQIFAVAAVGLPAQTTHMVGPGGLPQIRDALAIAAPGDTILVQPGTYAHFRATVGVQIRAQTPGNVQVQWDQAFAPGCSSNPFCALTEGATQLAPPAGQTLTLVGLEFPAGATPVFGGMVRNRLEVLGGRVVLDQCVVESIAPNALAVVNATLHLVGGEYGSPASSLVPFGTTVAMRAMNAAITAVGTRFVGSSPWIVSSGNVPAEAIVLSDSSMVGSRIDARGGRVVTGGPSANGISTDGGSLWLSDSHLQGGGSDSCAVVGSAAVAVARCTFGSGATGCPSLPSTALLGVAPPPAPTPGQTFGLHWQTEPNSLVGVLWSFDLATRPLPIFSQPWWAPTNSPTAGLFVADAQGQANGGWLLPNSQSLVGIAIWFHSFSGTSLPLSTAPVVGGVIR
jgi:hypothetical protein